MSCAIITREYDYDADKEDIQHDADKESEWYSDYRRNLCCKIKFHDLKLENINKAEAWLDSHSDHNRYYCGAVSFKGEDGKLRFLVRYAYHC